MPKLDNKLSSIVSSQIPDFIRADNEVFSEFIKAYYKFLEQEKNSQELLQNLKSYASIDETISSLIDRFFAMYGTDSPSIISADIPTFIKNIKDLYTSKGTEKSYNLLFTILYNEAIEFLYPWESVLKPSDGKWIQLYSLFLKSPNKELSNNIFKLTNSKIVGQTSGSSAIVNSVFKYTLQGEYIFEVFIDRDSINGNFISGEKILSTKLNNDRTITTVEAQIYPVLNDIDIIDGVIGYSVGDNIPISANTGATLFAEVTNVNEYGKILNINVKKSGIAYSSNTVINTPAPSVITSNVQYKLNNNIIELYFPKPHGIKRNSNITIQYKEDIRINQNSISNDGVIQTVIVKAIPNRYTIQLRADAEYYSQFTTGTATIKYNDIAILSPNVTTLRITEGYWKNTDGKLSENMMLEGRLADADETDPIFYQPFSYVIKSQHPIDDWRQYATKLLHPAGMQLFNELMVQNTKNDMLVSRVLSADDPEIGDVETYTGDLTTITVDTKMHKADFTYVYHKLF